MSEVTVISCNKCGARVGRASRTRIRWSAQPARREPWDLCPTCRDELLEFLGELPRSLPLFPAGDGAAAAGG
jgi:hypothetical protein